MSQPKHMKPILERVTPMNAEQKLYQFPNGYGASVVRGPYTYGGPDGLFELAVLTINNPKDWRLCYETPITNDVEGHLTGKQVTKLLRKIARLPSRLEEKDGEP